MYNKKQWESNELITKEALNNIENGIETLDKRKSNAYFIDLEEWGIHNGFLDERGYVLGDDGNYLPKYTDEEYEIAHNNKEGLNAALQYAVNNGYNTAVLPNSSEIFICWEEPNERVTAYWGYTKKHIIMPSNLTFDMNNSTIKVIFDSKNINPYDKAQHSYDNPIAHLNGYLISMNACYNSTIKNGTLLGTKYERAYIVDPTNESGQERGFDFGTGIYISQGSSFITIDHMTIKGFMADGITSMTDHDPKKGSSIYNPTFDFKGYIDNQGTLNTGDANAYSTDYLSIADWDTKEGIIRTNMGYSRVPNVHNETIWFSFYDENKNFMLRSEERYLQNFLVPKGAKYIRLSVFREENATLGFAKDFQVTPKAGEFCHIQFCEISENHRGGIANMINNTIIEKCKIGNNGKGIYEGVPQFTDTTRYCINCEDCLPLNLIARDNYFYTSFHGILYAGGTIHCENNIFYKIEAAALNVYNCENAFFCKNTLIGGQVGGSTGSSTYDRCYIIKDNKFINASIQAGDASNMVYQISGNIFKGVCTFNNYAPYSIVKDTIMEFERNDDNTYIGAGADVSNTDTTLIKLNGRLFSTARFAYNSNKNTRNARLINVNVNSNVCPVKYKKIYNTEVINCTNTDTDYVDVIVNEETNEKIRVFSGEVHNSSATDSQFGSLTAYANCDVQLDFLFENTEFDFTVVQEMFHPAWYTNEYRKIFNIRFENCKFNISYEDFKGIFNANSARVTGELIFENCTFKNETSKSIRIFNISSAANSDLVIKLNNCKYVGDIQAISPTETLVTVYKDNEIIPNGDLL